MRRVLVFTRRLHRALSADATWQLYSGTNSAVFAAGQAGRVVSTCGVLLASVANPSESPHAFTDWRSHDWRISWRPAGNYGPLEDQLAAGWRLRTAENQLAPGWRLRTAENQLAAGWGLRTAGGSAGARLGTKDGWRIS